MTLETLLFRVDTVWAPHQNLREKTSEQKKVNLQQKLVNKKIFRTPKRKLVKKEPLPAQKQTKRKGTKTKEHTPSCCVAHQVD